jgi:hypothetical protein
MDVLKSISQLHAKKKVASTMMFKLVRCQANFINNVKLTKTVVKQVNM